MAETKARDESEPKRDIAVGVHLEGDLKAHLTAVQQGLKGLPQFASLTPAAAKCVRWVDPTGLFVALKAFEGMQGGALWEMCNGLERAMSSISERKVTCSQAHLIQNADTH